MQWATYYFLKIFRVEFVVQSPFLRLAHPIIGSKTGVYSFLTGIEIYLQSYQHYSGSTTSIFLGNVLKRSPVFWFGHTRLPSHSFKLSLNEIPLRTLYNYPMVSDISNLLNSSFPAYQPTYCSF